MEKKPIFSGRAVPISPNASYRIILLTGFQITALYLGTHRAAGGSHDIGHDLLGFHSSVRCPDGAARSITYEELGGVPGSGYVSGQPSCAKEIVLARIQTQLLAYVYAWCGVMEITRHTATLRDVNRSRLPVTTYHW
jgi:hypothetical protein